MFSIRRSNRDSSASQLDTMQLVVATMPPVTPKNKTEFQIWNRYEHQ